MTTDDELINRTYRLDVGLVERLNAATSRLGVWPSDLVAALLRHALDDLEAGRWVPKRRPAWYTVVDEPDPAP